MSQLDMDASERERNVGQILTAERKNFRDLDENWKLAVKDYVLQTTNAAQKHMKPVISGPVHDLRQWISETAGHRLLLAERYSCAVAAVRHNDMCEKGIQLAVTTTVQHLSETLASEYGNTTDRKVRNGGK